MNGNDVLIAWFCRSVQLYCFHLDEKVLISGELDKAFNIFDSILFEAAEA